MCWYSTLAGLVMGIKMRPLVLGLSSGQTWPENHAPLFGGFDGDDDDDYHDYHDDDDDDDDHDDADDDDDHDDGDDD